MDVLVVKVTCWRLAHGNKPLWTIRSHPDHIASLYGIPAVSESIDTRTLQHQQPMFHHVNLRLRQCRSGLISKDVDRHVDEVQLMQSARWVHNLIEREIERGVSSERIIIAGFSQGGAVSFEAALTYDKPLAGILALSTYFATANSIKINPLHNSIPIFICHGSLDPVVPESLGRKSLATLQNLGFVPEYNSYPMEHAVSPQEIENIAAWISRILGPE